MRIIAFVYKGYAGPFVTMDLVKTFEELGHEVLVVKIQDIIDLIEKKVSTQEIIRVCAGMFLKPKADFAFGYGAIPIISLRDPESGLINLFEEFQIPYVSIYYDSPLHPQMFHVECGTHGSNLHYMFIWDKYYVTEMLKLGFKNVYYMPIGTNTKRYHKLDERAREGNSFVNDVSFVGTWSAKRELVMKTLSGFNLSIYGYGWDKRAEEHLRSLFKGEADNIVDLPQIYNFSKVNVNMTMEQGITSLNMRVFDVMACEGFVITDYKEDLETLFDIDKEIVCYRHVDELPGLVKYYLEHDEARSEKARAARRRVLREHNYKNRAEFILNTLRANGIGE